MTTEILFPDITLPLRDSVRDLYEESRSKIAMESGPNRMRRWNRVTPRIYELVWDMSQEEFAIFDEWYQYTINGGDQPFDIQIQDDLGFIGWITARGVADYSADVIDGPGPNWRVSWRVRSVQPIFYDRVSPQWRGQASFGMLNHGNLQVLKSLFGTATMGITLAKVFIPPPPPHASGDMGVVIAKGRLYPRPYWGAAIIGVTATGRLIDLGDPSLILQFDAVSWTPPTGDDVTLQFDDVFYVPPSVS
jgi:hypothetical protein